jgi:tetratricopeptide (TPR) repeat protein
MRNGSQVGTLATMPCADKFWVIASTSRCALPGNATVACVWLSVFFACGFIGCDRLTTSRYAQLAQDADRKSTQGDFDRAINLYEAALDDSPRCAEVHYRLALLYDDKLNDPINALHHFRRYLALTPDGAHANDVKNSMKRDEIAVLTALSGDSVVTRAEAARLRNENLNLRKELETRAGTLRRASDKSLASDTSLKKPASRKEGRTYAVQSGDTLASISRKFYKSSTRWKEILHANKQSIRDPKKLTIGQTLIIP